MIFVPAENAIEVDQVVRVFSRGTVRALDGVSLRVAPGQVFGLLGPNGSGKTTMVRILSTILKPSEGSARVAGFDVVRQGQQVRQHIGLAGQFATVDENLTGFENLRMIGRLNHLSTKESAARARSLLHDFDLDEAANRLAKTFSGGMRRRLDLAAALVARPPILFLDEPTTGLDPQSRQDLWAIIEGLVEGGTTVLLTTQYLDEADRLAQQLVVLDHGKIIAQGTSAELKSQLGATVLVLTLQSTADAQRTGEIVTDLSKRAVRVEGTVVELNVEGGPSSAADALRRVDAQGIIVAGLALREPSLDDVFLTLTGHRVVEDTALAQPAGANRREHS